MTPCVTRARRLVIELPAPVSMLRAHMGDAGFRSFTHMHFRSIARTAMLRFRVWCLATPEKEELEAAKSTSPTFFPKAILRQSSQKPFQQQLLPTSQSIILSETVWRLASFRKLWSPNCFHSFKLVSSQFQISFKIAVKGELQFLSALFENQESLRFLHFLNRT